MGMVIFSISVLSLLVRLAVSCDDTNFIYNGFKKTDLHFDGIAEVSPNGLLRMTNTTKNQQGHAFHRVPLRFKNNFDGSPCSFSTSFVFAIVSQYTDVSAHGFALVFSPTEERSGALPSQYLGLFNPANNGNASNHVLAVEFDTIFNIEFGDIDNNHVGIDVNGLRSVAAAPASYYAGDVGTFKNLSLFSGEPIQVWVEYNNEDMKLNVTISPVNVAKPSMPLLSSAINLSAIMYEAMYVGFSSSSGSVITSHYVLGWSFRINGQAPALSLSNLPLLPQRNKRKTTTSLKIGLSLAGVVFALGTLSGIGFLVSRKMRFKEVVEDWEIDYMTHRFSYKDLYKATRGFREEELLGVGGFGRVYKGKLPTSNIEVAVKRVSHNSQQAMREFVAEIMSIGRLRHRNLVQLLGYCRRKGEFLLVYEFLPNGSLDKLLFAEQWPTRVDWNQRFQIIKGVASGLFYLHEEWEQVVVHRDIKASNVLLDSEMNGKLGDFGLSRLYDHGSDPNTTTHIVGTMGYIAPELTSTGRATTHTDVFAFGVFVLEVACGRRPIEHGASTDSLNLIDWVRTCWRRGVLAETRDPKLGTDFVMQELELVLKIGLICSHPSPAARPSMRQVVQYLHGDLPLPKLSIAETGSLMST
ncbi:hypothetical protein J5N97_004796 [Dioscorea zingiberensis]|uniref:non-specific serine/threonine protein kinase n=1 Tax=Dioscorea zingiberensis TaxID=325984 RepID=A0A9D5D9A6_9LILI|nr:hypothetical protein J5N97_004796 [Dioscorea zingiberensis]